MEVNVYDERKNRQYERCYGFNNYGCTYILKNRVLGFDNGRRLLLHNSNNRTCFNRQIL